VALWSLAGIYRTFYLAVGDGGRMVVNSGLPFHLGRRRYHETVVRTDLGAAELTSDERLWLYRPMPRPDAMEMAVRLLAAHGQEEAARLAGALPAAMQRMRLGDVLPEEA